MSGRWVGCSHPLDAFQLYFSGADLHFYTLTFNAWTVSFAEIATHLQIEIVSFQGCFKLLSFTLLVTKLYFHFKMRSQLN